MTKREYDLSREPRCDRDIDGYRLFIRECPGEVYRSVLMDPLTVSGWKVRSYCICIGVRGEFATREQAEEALLDHYEMHQR